MIKFNVKFINSRFCVVFTVLLSEMLGAESRNKQNYELHNCNNISSQTHYSLHDMTAVNWYGVEILENGDRSRPSVDSCIRIELQEDTNKKNHVHLIWRERNLEVTYKFVKDDEIHPGIWTSLGNQDVNKKPNGYEYEQFAGKVYVMKASDSDAVLTFCSLTKLFTLVLSKTHAMNSTELTSIHNLIERFGGPKSNNVKTFCKNGGFMTEPHVFLILMVIAIAFMSRTRFCKV